MATLPSADPTDGASVRSVAHESAPKTTRPDSPSRREDLDGWSVQEWLGRPLDAFPDKIDLRDWTYTPTLHSLPDAVNNCHHVPGILDQQREGACTGFALAAVINYLLQQRKSVRRVSPRMLYELARHYDEWPGEDYVGSSARGTMKGWARHGVCQQELWPQEWRGSVHLDQQQADDARLTPCGAYYRVDFRQVRHVHAALYEVGIVFATVMIHAGWDLAEPRRSLLALPGATSTHGITLPVIPRRGTAEYGHAIAIVGYTDYGFIIQNSWGTRWGKYGFALLPYEDFLMHTTDVWVAQLGVPVQADVWTHDAPAGSFRALQTIPLSDIRPYVVDIGNNGLLSTSGNYWTTEADIARLFTRTIPEKTAGWNKQRLLLYMHGGLNSEADAAKRIVSYRDICLANEIYPLHIMWETGWFMTIKQMIADWFTAADTRAGGTFLDYFREARDRVLELTLAAPGSKLWQEMKENARLASTGMQSAMQLLAYHARAGQRQDWELHVVAHSAGAILMAHALNALLTMEIPWKTLQFMAPALRADTFKQQLAAAIQVGTCPQPSLYLLSTVGELDDDVGPYGKSLLYLVSNAFEGQRDVPLIGMQKWLDEDPAISTVLNRPVDGRPGIVIAGQSDAVGSTSKSDSHSGFDNDPNTLNSILVRILGQAPARPFTARDLQF